MGLFTAKIGGREKCLLRIILVFYKQIFNDQLHVILNTVLKAGCPSPELYLELPIDSNIYAQWN